MNDQLNRLVFTIAVLSRLVLSRPILSYSGHGRGVWMIYYLSLLAFTFTVILSFILPLFFTQTSNGPYLTQHCRSSQLQYFVGLLSPFWYN